MGQGDETYMLEARLERQHMESEVLLNVIRSHASTTDTDDFPDAVHRARRRLCGFWDRIVLLHQNGQLRPDFFGPESVWRKRGMAFKTLMEPIDSQIISREKSNQFVRGSHFQAAQYGKGGKRPERYKFLEEQMGSSEPTWASGAASIHALIAERRAALRNIDVQALQARSASIKNSSAAAAALPSGSGGVVQPLAAAAAPSTGRTAAAAAAAPSKASGVRPPSGSSTTFARLSRHNATAANLQAQLATEAAALVQSRATRVAEKRAAEAEGTKPDDAHPVSAAAELASSPIEEFASRVNMASKPTASSASEIQLARRADNSMPAPASNSFSTRAAPSRPAAMSASRIASPPLAKLKPKEEPRKSTPSAASSLGSHRDASPAKLREQFDFAPKHTIIQQFNPFALALQYPAPLEDEIPDETGKGFTDVRSPAAAGQNLSIVTSAALEETQDSAALRRLSSVAVKGLPNAQPELVESPFSEPSQMCSIFTDHENKHMPPPLAIGEEPGRNGGLALSLAMSLALNDTQNNSNPLRLPGERGTGQLLEGLLNEEHNQNEQQDMDQLISAAVETLNRQSSPEKPPAMERQASMAVKLLNRQALQAEAEHHFAERKKAIAAAVDKKKGSASGADRKKGRVAGPEEVSATHISWPKRRGAAVAMQKQRAAAAEAMEDSAMAMDDSAMLAVAAEAAKPGRVAPVITPEEAAATPAAAAAPAEEGTFNTAAEPVWPKSATTPLSRNTSLKVPAMLPVPEEPEQMPAVEADKKLDPQLVTPRSATIKALQPATPDQSAEKPPTQPSPVTPCHVLETPADFLSSGSIPHLVRQLSIGDIDAKMSAAWALHSKAKSSRRGQVGDAVWEAEGVAPLVAMLATTDSATAVPAAAAIAQLASKDNKAFQIGVSEAGGVPALLKLAECATPGATAAAAAALGSLTAQNKAVQDAMLNADAAQILVGLLGSPAIKEAAAAAADERDAALAAAIASFGAGNLAAQEAVVQARGIPKLLALLKSPDTIVQQHSSAALLAIVGKNARHQHALRDCEGIPDVVGLLEGCPDRAAPTGAAENAARLLYCLACFRASHADMQAAGAIDALVPHLAAEDMTLKMNAVWAIQSMSAGSTETEEGIRAAGGVPALLELLRAEQAERGTPSETGLDTAGEPDLELLEPAVIALSNLAASNESNKREIASAGGIPVLVQLLAMQGTVAAYAARAIWNLSLKHPANQDAAREAGAVTALVHMLQSCPGQPKPSCGQEEAAGALSALAKGNKPNQDAIRNAGGITHLLEQLTVALPAVKDQAAWALNALTEQNPDNQAELLSLDGAAKICGMLKFPEQWNWTPLVGILRNLAKGEPSAREKLLEAGAVPVLADILACGRPSLQVISAETLGYLGASCAEGKSGIEESGAVGTLNELAGDASVAPEPIKKAAQQALQDLGCLPKGRKRKSAFRTFAREIINSKRWMCGLQPLPDT